MKHIVILVISLTISLKINAQILTPVHWSYGTKKINADTYEIHLKAELDQGWHIYSQTQPNNAVAQATKIVFKNDSRLELIGKPKELGKMEKYYNKAVDIGANQYAGTVDFVETVKIKDKSVKNIAVTVTFQTCTDQRCLPPDNIQFSIPIK